MNRYPTRGPGRPQILLIGNGLEFASGQKSWEDLLKTITVCDPLPLDEEQLKAIPFPLLYQLLATPDPAPAHMSADDILAEDKRLAQAVKRLQHQSNSLLALLPDLGADHIFTTNYSYCLEKAFFPGVNFMSSSNRSKKRLRLIPTNETVYKMHSGYLAGTTGLWHIHGECGAPKGIVLGHDRYGRLLSRIEDLCKNQHYTGKPEEVTEREFTSWPELFLYADVYILGLGMYECEYDLWWLLRRKQREYYADGRVYYYDHPKNGAETTKHKLLQACGAELRQTDCPPEASFDDFYRRALEEIREQMQRRRMG